MKTIKMLLFLILSIVFISTISLRVNADFGPKPFVHITIIGMENKTYTATLISKEANGPNFFYEDYLEFGDPWMDYHPIMEYVDTDGYKWIGNHWNLEGNDEFEWSYYPPSDFKVLIMTEDNVTYTTGAIERYAFGSYFQVDASNVIDGELAGVRVIETISPNYNYVREILAFFIRLIVTLGIELALALAFGFRKKNEIYAILVVNTITLVFLHALLNVTTYYEGEFLAIGFFILGEMIVFLVESIFYLFYFQKKKARAFFYGILANLLSCGMGLLLFILEMAI